MSPKPSRRTRGKSLRRSAGHRPERKTIVVFTEGKNSEPDYVNGLKKLPHIAENVALNIEIHPDHGVPLTLVQLAADTMTDTEIDECWCLFDVEWPKNHPNLDPAVALARSAGVRLAISNPCFELWLILHHRQFGRFTNTDEAESASRKIDGRVGKSIDVSVYMPLRKQAAQRAKALEKRHKEDGTPFPHDNPSSGMHHFLVAVEPGNAQ